MNEESIELKCKTNYQIHLSVQITTSPIGFHSQIPKLDQQRGNSMKLDKAALGMIRAQKIKGTRQTDLQGRRPGPHS